MRRRLLRYPGGGSELMGVLLALVPSLCAAAVAVLFVTMWVDGDGIATAALGVALFSILLFAVMAWREAL